MLQSTEGRAANGEQMQDTAINQACQIINPGYSNNLRFIQLCFFYYTACTKKYPLIPLSPKSEIT